MQLNSFGKLWPVSALTLGGGGLGMVSGETTFDECVATVHAAIAAGINLIDLAPSYGQGKAEEVVGEAFGGRLPEGVRVTSKCNLGNAPRAEIEPLLRQSIEGSLKRLRLSRLDLFFLHSNLVPDAQHVARRPDAASRMTLYDTFVADVRPVFERLVGEGLIGAWGLTGIGPPDTIIQPAARANEVGVMGIRAVQAGGLTSALDRPLPADHPEMRDYIRAASFRRVAAELGVTPALLAHRYALSLAVDTVVLGVKNREELAECVAAAEAGPLPAELLARVDQSVDRAAAV